MKIQKNLLFFFDFPAFLEKSKKKQGFFLDFKWFYSKNPKKPMVFFGFSRFLLLENLENPKKTIVCFWIFPAFLEKSKKT